jgi:hypothetical protein
MRPTSSTSLNRSHTDNLHNQLRPVVLSRRDILNFAKRQHAVNDLPKDDVLSIQEVAFRCGYEKLQVLRTRLADRSIESNTWHPFVFVPEFAYNFHE